MTQSANYFKLGLFVILAFCLGVGFLIMFGAGEFLKKEILAETCFNESVQGLDVGSEVKYKGVRIGTVKAITTPVKVYQAQSRCVLVVFALDLDAFPANGDQYPADAVKAAVDNGLTVYLSFKGLTGAAYLETDYLPGIDDSVDITWTPDNLYIPSRKSSIKRLSDAVNLILENLTEINIMGMTSNLEKLLDTLNQKTAALDVAGISQRTTAMMDEVRNTSRILSETLDSPDFHDMIQDAKGSFTGIRTLVTDVRDPVNQTLEDLGHAAASARTMTQNLEQRTDTRLTALSQQVDGLMESLNTTIAMLENLVWLNSDTINRTISNFEHTSENLKQMSLEIRRYPARLLLERPPKSQEEQTKGGR
ncbi:MAG: MlaD family protein [Desulfotignum sp.]|nr:MlaD family protein [Desulfotignum sp.]MCF8088171.1 MlaD family protein [Desulfotignum sp.]MCF8138698.1 MlaD family protein [Desulfotignum sp.]